MTYTINPNAKDVWIRDNEDTMDLSPITDASTVYLENGRTIEQELGEGSMVSNVATVNTSMNKVIDGTLDGAYESLVFKGKSLVNLITKYRNNNTSQTLTISGRTYVVADRRDMPLKSNTKYLIQFNVSSLNLDGRTSVDLVFQQNAGVIFDGNVTASIVQTGVHSVVATTIPSLPVVTDSDWSQNAFVIKGMASQWENSTSTERTLTISDVMIIEYQQGMENWDIPYFTGICDVKMPILRNVGKNLLCTQDYFPKGTITNVEVTQNTLKATAKGAWHGFEYILQLKPNTEYTFSFERDSDTTRGYIRHPENKGWTGGYGGSSNYTFTTRSTGVIRFTIESSLANNTIVVRNPMIIEGSLRPISYENHKTNILRTPEEIVLREVNGVQDTYNPLTGEYVRRISEVVFDGSSDEDWSVNKNITGGKQFVYNASLGAKGGNATVISDKLPSIVDANESHVENIWIYNGTTIVIHKNLQDANELKTWLSQNPITVQYELATPIITTVDPIGVPFAYENGHVILESGYEGQSLLPAMEYSTTINKTGQIKNIGNTILRQEKQLTTMEKMLIQNIIDLGYNNALTKIKLAIEEVK